MPVMQFGKPNPVDFSMKLDSDAHRTRLAILNLIYYMMKTWVEARILRRPVRQRNCVSAVDSQANAKLYLMGVTLWWRMSLFSFHLLISPVIYISIIIISEQQMVRNLC